MPIYRLADTGSAFPSPHEAEPDGLLAVGGDLSVRRLLTAYAAGIFPWYSAGSPILWWSPDPRCVLFPEEFHIPRSLRRTLRGQPFFLTRDTAFERVIRACAAPRRIADPHMQGSPLDHTTWLVPEMISAYCALFRIGLAHSFEAWHKGELVGGLYGVSLGRMFFGESMFHTRNDASKAALVHLVETALAKGISCIDCQQQTDNLLRFGARPLPRAEFLDLLKEALRFPTLQGSWSQQHDCPADSLPKMSNLV